MLLGWLLATMAVTGAVAWCLNLALPHTGWREEASLPVLILTTLAVFMVGVAFAYYVAMPPAFRFFATFGSSWVDIQPTISSYINVVTRLMIGVGLSFEMPLIIMVLARIGVVSPKWLAGKRKVWVVVAFVLGAIITPTFDPINQTIIAAPLIVLYELSIWLAKLVYKKKKEPEVEPAED